MSKTTLIKTNGEDMNTLPENLNLVLDRIEQAPFCEVINLDDEEKKLYTGAGFRLARFVEGKLDALFDPMQVPMGDSIEEDAKEGTKQALEFAKADGQYFEVMCSNYQLCEPVSFSLLKDEARLIRKISEQFAECC